LVVLFIGAFVSGSIGLGSVGRLARLRETHVTAAAVANLRQCRMEAIARNAPISWWIERGHFVWWHDANENGVHDSGELSSALLSEEVTYMTFPNQGTFDGRGTHSTTTRTFPGMVLWIYFADRTELVTVSSNGDIRAPYTS
jgi:hypothetical protein